MKYIIRNARATDMTEIIRLCSEHAAYEKADYSMVAKKKRLASFLFTEKPSLYCLIVENDESILGYATYTFEFSTWDARFYIHMDCLYLRPHARGYGIGERLIKEIARQAKIHGCQQLQWQTPVSNKRAVQFYYRMGAASKEKIRLYLDENAINNLIKYNT